MKKYRVASGNNEGSVLTENELSEGDFAEQVNLSGNYNLEADGWESQAEKDWQEIINTPVGETVYVNNEEYEVIEE